MSSPLPAVARFRRSAAAFAALGVVLAGCDATPIGKEEKVAQTTGVNPSFSGGAVLTVPDRVVAGQPVAVSAVGSTFEKTPKTCAAALFFFLETKADEFEEQAFDQKSLATNKGEPCAVTAGAASVTFPAGAPGSERAMRVHLTVEGEGEKGIWKSRVNKRVTIVTPSTALPVIAPPQQYTAPPAPPAPAPADVRCATVTRIGGATGNVAPHADLLANPFPPVAGEEVVLDATSSSDPDGTIVQYRWDIGNDGTVDRTTAAPTTTFTPTAAGEHEVCLTVVDDAGARGQRGIALPVEPAGTFRGADFHISPSSPAPSQPFTVIPGSVPGTTHVAFDTGGGFGPDMPVGATTAASLPAGLHLLSVLYIDANANTTSTWSRFLRVGSGRSARLVATAAQKKKGGKKTATEYTLTTTLKTTRSIITAGRTKYDAGELSTKGARMRGRMRSGLSKSKQKKVPSALRFLLDADYASTFDGKRVAISPTASGIQGTGKILARSRKHRGTRVCISVKTDGRTADGTTWTVLGATGRAAGYVGGGTGQPPILEGDPEPQKVTLTLKKGKKKGVKSCSSLQKDLPKKAKKPKRKKK